MEVINFGEKLNKKSVLCLGHFDGLHVGHQAVLKRATEVAKSLNASLAVFTFDDDFCTAVKGEKSIFTLKERLYVFERFGVDGVIVASCKNGFLQTPPREFLIKLFSHGDIAAVAVGDDYTFGACGAGDAKLLKKVCGDFGVGLHVVGGVYADGVRVSSTLIRGLLESGEVEKANGLLGFEFFSIANVVNGENVGRVIGFPTLNTFFPFSKKQLRRGVYETRTEVGGAVYKSITNFGSAPTFNRNNLIIETHILDFSDDVYGEEVKIGFVRFLRGVKKFDSIDELIGQIESDIQRIRGKL